MVNRITRNTLVGIFALTLGSGGLAFADEAPTKTAVKAETEVGTSDDVAAAPAGVTKAAVEEDSSSSWPVEMINRNLTLPKGAWSAGVAGSANNDFSEIGAEATGLWGISYGVTDKLSVGVGYGFGLEPSSDGKGPIGFNVAYTYHGGGNLSLAATVAAGYDAAGEALTPLSVGTYVWYNVTPKITLITPGGQLNVGLEDPNEIGLTAPVSVGYQFTRNVFGTFDTNLLPNLKIKDGASEMLGSDVIPVGASAYFSPSNKMDIGLSISTDAKNSPGDNLGFGLLFVYYGGV